jgi:hypothetical protein
MPETPRGRSSACCHSSDRQATSIGEGPGAHRGHRRAGLPLGRAPRRPRGTLGPAGAATRGLYLAHRVEHASELYGSLGVAAAILAWLYLIARLMVGSAMLNATLYEHRHHADPAEPPS